MLMWMSCASGILSLAMVLGTSSTEVALLATVQASVVLLAVSVCLTWVYCQPEKVE
jgi:hypothetical protein